MPIPTDGRNFSIRFESNGVSIAGVSRHVNIAGGDSLDVAPIMHSALANFIVTNSRHRPIGVKAYGMTTTSGHRVLESS